MSLTIHAPKNMFALRVTIARGKLKLTKLITDYPADRPPRVDDAVRINGVEWTIRKVVPERVMYTASEK